MRLKDLGNNINHITNCRCGGRKGGRERGKDKGKETSKPELFVMV